MQTLIHYPSLVNDTFNSFMHQFVIRVLTPSLTERLMASFNLVLTFESVDSIPVSYTHLTLPTKRIV